jgi:hypothetical protein
MLSPIINKMFAFYVAISRTGLELGYTSFKCFVGVQSPRFIRQTLRLYMHYVMTCPGHCPGT